MLFFDIITWKDTAGIGQWYATNKEIEKRVINHIKKEEKKEDKNRQEYTKKGLPGHVEAP